MVLNRIVEFFSDTTTSDHIYLASPLSVVQSLNFTITITGGRLRALKPIIPPIQFDQEYSPVTYHVEPELIDPRFMEIPVPTYLDTGAIPDDCTPAWTDYQPQQGTEFTSSREIVSPPPVRVSGNSPAVLPGQFHTDEQPSTFQPAAEYSLQSSAAEVHRQAPPPAAACVNIQPVPSKEPQAKEKIPRPQNAFIQYRNATLHQVKAEMRPGVTWQEISLEVGKRWKALSEEDKKPFRDGQALAEAEHKRLYPDYKYQPGEKKKSRSRKQ
ncbi:high mobility group box domain-containing protein [Xylaria sp. FL0064]|nr:high mobility group box domain-containing protein [Xylaria sp. FL0064]